MAKNDIKTSPTSIQRSGYASLRRTTTFTKTVNRAVAPARMTLSFAHRFSTNQEAKASMSASRTRREASPESEVVPDGAGRIRLVARVSVANPHL